MIKKAMLSFVILASLSVGLSANNDYRAKDKPGKDKSPMKELNLTADQQKQMESLHESYRAKREKLMDEYNKDVEKILTPEQKTQWEAMQKQKSEHKKGKKKGKRGSNVKSATPAPLDQESPTQG